MRSFASVPAHERHRRRLGEPHQGLHRLHLGIRRLADQDEVAARGRGQDRGLARSPGLGHRLHLEVVRDDDPAVAHALAQERRGSPGERVAGSPRRSPGTSRARSSPWPPRPRLRSRNGRSSTSSSREPGVADDGQVEMRVEVACRRARESAWRRPRPPVLRGRGSGPRPAGPRGRGRRRGTGRRSPGSSGSCPRPRPARSPSGCRRREARPRGLRPAGAACSSEPRRPRARRGGHDRPGRLADAPPARPPGRRRRAAAGRGPRPARSPGARARGPPPARARPRCARTGSTWPTP